MGKIFGDPISPQNIQTRFLCSLTDFQGHSLLNTLGMAGFKVAFTAKEDLLLLLDNHLWFVQGQIFHLQRWIPTFDLTRDIIDHLLVWVRLHFLPFHFWNEQTITKLVEMIRCCDQLEAATLESHTFLFARTYMKLSLLTKIPRVLDLKPDPNSDKIILLHLHYETLFECCFYCGLVQHTQYVCPEKMFDHPYLIVDRYP